MGKALYRKYRSRKLSEIVGQEHVTTLLSNALKSGRIAHAYLFTGPRGTGKTSIARILAHEINKLPYSDDSEHLDIIEIDAASNNGVDDIRDLRDKVQLAPIKAEKKIYIIDEVHMLSKPAFNALLKTLEEPPEHIVFILATTDVDKLPETIISRTQRHTFHRASIKNIVENLKHIAKAEKVSIDDKTLERIAENSDGSYRDSVSLFDQIINLAPEGEKITPALIESILGLASHEVVENLVAAAKAHDLSSAATQLTALESQGIQPKVITRQLIRYLEKTVADDRTLLPLLDELLTVEKSSFPQTKLLTVLGTFAAPKSSSKATAVAAAPTIVAAIPELVKKATEPAPKDDIALDKLAEPLTTSSYKTSAAPTDPVAYKRDVGREAVLSDDGSEMANAKAVKQKKFKKLTTNIDLAQLLSTIKTDSIGLHSVLEKCAIEVDGENCIIYAKNAFYKKKLDNSRYKAGIIKALNTQAEAEWEIETIPGSKPPKDSQAAQVAAIMGGGEEVNIDE